MTDVQLIGADRLASTLRDAADKLADLTAAHSSVAKLIAGAVHPPVLSGALAGSITTDTTPTEAIVGSALVYAPVQEFGWPGHNIRARRFLAGAAQVTEPAQIQTYVAAVAAAVAGVKGI